MAQPRSVAPYERRLVRRTRLLEQFDDVEARTILLLAPAGYGKTTLARQWLDRAPGAWLGVTSASCDIPVLARDLGAAIGEIAEIDVRRIETALKAASAPLDQARAVARTILGQVTSRVPGWLVIDDYHVLMSNPAAEELIWTLERSARFRLMFTSRERPSWATSRRRVHLELLEVGAAELALDDDEVAELLPTNRRTEALRKQARGWPAVIALAAYSNAPDMPLSLDALSETLYDYLAEELFERAPPDVQRSLTAIALLSPSQPRELAELLEETVDLTRVLSTGLAYEAEGQIEVHPLARAFLLTKARARPDSEEFVRKSIDLVMEHQRWDAAFDLIAEFDVHDRLEGLITLAFSTLVETGRLATLEGIGRFAAIHSAVSVHLLELIDSEIALRDGAFDRARVLGRSASDAAPEGDTLKARGYWIAGSAAQLEHRLEEALDLHSRAAQVAIREDDVNDAAWGKCVAALRLEHDRMRETLSEFEAITVRRPEDRLRISMARHMYASRTTGFADVHADGTASFTTDPWVRTSWGNIYGYCLMLQSRYEEARNVLVATMTDVDAFGLSFARPRVEPSLAYAELGLRQFGRCDALLRRMEDHQSRGQPDPLLRLNARMLRARLLLARQRPNDAVLATTDEFEVFPDPAIHGEYLATRALTLAANAQHEQALEAVAEAKGVTGTVETQVLSASAEAIVSLGTSGADDAAGRLLELALRLRTWDGVVCAIRASRGLMVGLASVPGLRDELRQLLYRSNDVALARAVGLVTRSSGPRGVLSAREREVIDLLRVGLKNDEIATALFISAATVKVHVRHILEKLRARTRAEAVARYAEIDTGTGGNSRTGS